MLKFFNLQDGSSHHLGFLNFQIFSSQLGLESTVRNLIIISQMAVELLHLTVFKTAVNCYFRFLKFEFFNNW